MPIPTLLETESEVTFYKGCVCVCTGHTQKNGAVSKVYKEFISNPIRAQHALPTVSTIHVCHEPLAVCISCLLRGRGTSFQDGVAALECSLCALF
jgi:hypothetical protein